MKFAEQAPLAIQGLDVHAASDAEIENWRAQKVGHGHAARFISRFGCCHFVAPSKHDVLLPYGPAKGGGAIL
jgi:hypothetical protein